MDTAHVATSVCAGEIVRPGSFIQLTFSQPVEPHSARRGILVNGQPRPSHIEVLPPGNAARLRLPKDLLGPCELAVVGVHTRDRKLCVAEHRVPFAIVPIDGANSDDDCVEHALRLEVKELEVSRLPPGTTDRSYIEVLKLSGRSGRAFRQVAYDDTGAAVDLSAVLAQVEERRRAKYGKIHEALYEKMQQAAADERIDIVVWAMVTVDPAPYEKLVQDRYDEPPKGEYEVLDYVAGATNRLRDTLLSADLDPHEDEYVQSPYIRTSATRAQIEQLAARESVGGVFFDDRSVVEDLASSIKLARSDVAHDLGVKGAGVRVAVWEDGPQDTSDLVFDAAYSTNPPASPHGRLTSAIIKNVEPGKPHGHAPECSLYSANLATREALNWAVAQNCTVINQSFHRMSEARGAALQVDDLHKDWLALRNPFPLIVQSSGNFAPMDEDAINPPAAEYVNHKGFNGVTVGNHDGQRRIAKDSVYRNPRSDHGDRELPDLSADGTNVVALGFPAASGTSFSAPAVAGVAALLQCAGPGLAAWPECCRAILLACAFRGPGQSTLAQEIASGIDAQVGAGAVDAAAAVTIARRRRLAADPPVDSGWDAFTLSNAQLDADGYSTFSYKFQATGNLASSTARVALCWNSGVVSNGLTATSSVLSVDLDLLVLDAAKNVAACSSSFDNSYEVATFKPRAGETYEIVVRRTSGSVNVWCGLAWIVAPLHP